MISLIGRGQIADKIGRMPGPADHIQALRDYQPEALAEEERYKMAMRAAKAEGRDGEDEEDQEDEEDEDEDGDEEEEAEE